jgi:MFS family permease
MQSGTTRVNPARLGAFTFGIQVVWGAILGVSLQARTIEFSGAQAVTIFSYVLATGAALAAITQVVAGIASDERSKRVGNRLAFYLWGVALAIPALVWFYLTPNLVQFVIAFFALQIALNVATGPYQAAIPDHIPIDRRGLASSWMSGWQSFGNAVGLVIVAFINDLRVVAALLAVALASAWTVTFTHVRNFSIAPAPAARFRADGTFVALLLSRGTINLGFFTLLGYLLFFVKFSLGVDAAKVQTATGLVFLTFTLCGILGAALAARPSDRYDLRAVATIANCGVIAALALLASAHTLAVAFVAAAIAGACWGAFFTSDWALACALLPRGAMATAMGVWNVATAGPQVLAPLLALPVVTYFNGAATGAGYRAAILLAVVEFAIGTALLWRLPSTRALAAPSD